MDGILDGTTTYFTDGVILNFQRSDFPGEQNNINSKLSSDIVFIQLVINRKSFIPAKVCLHFVSRKDIKMLLNKKVNKTDFK